MTFKRYIKYIVSLFSLLVFSCADEGLGISKNPWDQNSDLEAAEGENIFDLYVDNFNVRTRDISFAEGATVRINSLWLGVFNQETGACVENLHTNQDYAMATSGEEGHGVLRVKWADDSEAMRDVSGNILRNQDGNFFMVAVANYKDVYGHLADDGTANGQLLEELLENVKSWSDFNKIGVATKSAYEGDHYDDAPVMAGFLNSKKAFQAHIPSSTHIKVNQFGNKNVDLLPEKLVDNETNILDALKIKYNGNDNVKRYVAVDENGDPTVALNHTIFFRRLIANINVNIEPMGTISVTEVAFRRFNLPRIVYIMERALIDPETNEFPVNGEKSPNFGDMYPTEGGYYNDDDEQNKNSDTTANGDNPDKAEGEWSEEEANWKTDNVTRSDDGTWHFTFQHFANKHWGRSKIKDIDNIYKPTTYAERERRLLDTEEYPYFPALAENSKDINNNASYFMVKMHLVNSEKNRCAEASYTIHEGYTSDEQGYAVVGSETDKVQKRLLDFSTARNINYNYNIRVHSFENILFNVNEGENDNEFIHRSDFNGSRVWQFNYVNEEKDPKTCNSIEYSVKYDPTIGEKGDFYGAISDQGGIYENAIKVKSGTPDLAFRLYGYNSAKGVETIEGYNYNFPDNSFRWLNGLWPPSMGKTSHYFQNLNVMLDKYNDDLKEDGQIDNLLLNAFKIIDAEYFDEEQEALLGTENADQEYENKWMDIVQFIKSYYIQEGENWVLNPEMTKEDKVYNLKVAPRQIDGVSKAEKGEYIRALYIADRSGEKDKDQCTTLVNIYAAVQDPPTYNTFNATPIYKDEQYKNWQDNWNVGRSNYSEGYIYYANTSAGSEWTCNTNSVVNLGFKIEEDLGRNNYKLIIKDSDGKAVYTQTYSNINKDPNNNCIKLPLLTNWESVSAGVYDVILTLDDNGSKIQGNRELSFPSKLYLGTSSWSMGDTYWQRYTYTNAKDNRYFGFSGDYDTRGSNKYTKEKNLFMEYNGLELGVFETRDVKPFIEGSGYLNTMADYDPGSDSENPRPNIDIQPMEGKSYQLKFNVTKSGVIHLNVKNSNTNDKYWYFEFGDNITNIKATFSKTNNRWEDNSYNNYQFLCKNDDTYDELKITYEIKDPKRTDGNEVKVYTRKHVLHLQKLWVTDN